MPVDTGGPGLHVGLQNKLYVEVFPDNGWIEIPIVGDVTLNLGCDLAEVKSRASEFKQGLPTLLGAPLEFDMLADTSLAFEGRGLQNGSPLFNVLRDAYFKDAPLRFAISDQDITQSGAEYFSGLYIIYGFSMKQALEEAQMVKVTADLGYVYWGGDLVTPGFVTVA